MSSSIYQMISDFLYLAPAILIALSFHEYAHGYVSYKLGDPTPVHDGRLTLNPLKHIDPVGLLFLLVFRFGWAKPVMVNPQYYKRPKRDMALVSIAGPATNFVLAFIGIFVMVVLDKLGVATSVGWRATYHFFVIFALINIGLGIFNLIPIPPLDGSKVLGAFFPDDLYDRYMRLGYGGMGMLLIFALIFFGVFTGPLITMRNALLTGFVALADKLTFFLS